MIMVIRNLAPIGILLLLNICWGSMEQSPDRRWGSNMTNTWHLQNQQRCIDAGYTIVISSFDRFHALTHTAIPHWMTCPHVKQIHIVHHNPNVSLS